MKYFTAFLVLVLVPLFCAQDKMKAPAKDKSMAAPTSFKSSVQKMADDWLAAFQAKDADKIAAMYSDDAVWINVEGTFHGPSEIKGELKKMMDRGDGVEAITTTKAVHFGQIGYAEGTFSGQAPNQSGTEGPAGGTWVVSLKSSDGKWMMAAHTSVPAAPASSMSKATKKPE
jgi:uncharacterized protein (TIGR02246 family)